MVWGRAAYEEQVDDWASKKVFAEKLDKILEDASKDKKVNKSAVDEIKGAMEDKDFVVRGVAHDDKVAKIAVLGIPNTPGIAHEIFSALAESNIDVDMIVQSIRNIEKNVTEYLKTL